MSWILSLRQCAKKLSNAMTAQGYVMWSDDGERISFKDFNCSMTNFRSFVVIEMRKAQDELAKLFLIEDGFKLENVLPPVRLVDIKDNPGEDRPGWNFLKDERNRHLFDGSNWMMDRITESPRLLHQFFQDRDDLNWRIQAIRQYLDDVTHFLERILLLVHITGGQPARATEIFQVRHHNIIQGEHRNLFIEDGLVSIVTTYHKGYSMEGTTKIIHRYLPREVSELVVYYHWLILPFRWQLEMLALGKMDPISPLLWATDNKQWKDDRLCKIFEKESDEILKSTLNIRIYRHVAVAMARKHISPNHFKRHAAEEDNVWDLQAAHKTPTAGAIYARGLRDAPGFAESRRASFRRISREWHLFQGFKTWEIDNRRPCPFPEYQGDDIWNAPSEYM